MLIRPRCCICWCSSPWPSLPCLAPSSEASSPSHGLYKSNPLVISRCYSAVVFVYGIDRSAPVNKNVLWWIRIDNDNTDLILSLKMQLFLSNHICYKHEPNPSLVFSPLHDVLLFFFNWNALKWSTFFLSHFHVTKHLVLNPYHIDDTFRKIKGIYTTKNEKDPMTFVQQEKIEEDFLSKC